MLEIIVERADHGLAGQPVGDAGEAAQIGRHDDGAQRLEMAAQDLAVEDALADMAAVIDREERRARCAATAIDLDDRGKRRADVLEEAPGRAASNPPARSVAQETTG